MKFSIATAALLLLSFSSATTSHAQVIFDDMPALALGVPTQAETQESNAGGLKRQRQERMQTRGGKGDKECDPNKVVLADYPQWQAEQGYWIGEYSFYGSDGKPYTSTWPYKYDAYKGLSQVMWRAMHTANVMYFFILPGVAKLVVPLNLMWLEMELAARTATHSSSLPTKKQQLAAATQNWLVM